MCTITIRITRNIKDINTDADDDDDVHDIFVDS
jgi:hypothetical protein